MLRVALAAALLFAPALARAQEATGAVLVAVREASGAPLGGLAVRLVTSAGGVEAAATTDAGGDAVLLHVRPGAYALAAGDGPALPDAARVAVAPGGETPVHVTWTGTPETTRVVAGTPRSGPGRLVTGDALTEAPRPSDPWSRLRDVPGLVLDRVDVGGSETAQQSVIVAHGDGGTGTTWTIDGADITDPAAVGSTSLYPDLDGFEAVSVRTAPLDARVRTPGVQVALVTRDPGDRLAGHAHARTTGPQSDNLTDALRGRPFFRNRTRRALDLGGDVGGPLVRGRAWGWAGFGLDTLRQETFTEHEERLRVGWGAAKARVRLGSGQASLLLLRSEKVHEDRDTGLSASAESRWRQSGPATLLAAEDRRTLGRVSLLTHASWLDAGFRLVPQGGDAVPAYEDFRGVFQRSYETFETDRPRVQIGAEAALSARGLGLAHRLSAGLGYRRSVVATRAWWPGNEVLGYERQTVFFRTFRLTGFAQPTRAQSARSSQDETEAWAEDALRRGPLSATLGLRLDRAAGRDLPSSVEANPVFPTLLPAAAYAGGDTRLRWTDLLPRVGLAWDVRDDGSSVAGLSYAAYAAPLGTGDVTFANPLGREPAVLTYYWIDRDGDHAVEPGELDLGHGLLGASGAGIGPPSAPRSPNTIDPATRAPRAREVATSLEHAFGRGLRVGARGAWRRVDRLLWRPLIGLTLADYALRGGVQGTLLGEAYDVGYFAPASTSRLAPGNGRRLTNRPGYFQDAWTAELTAGGRLGREGTWEAWGSATDWREHFPEPALSIQDPTPTEGEPLQDAGIVAVRPGGLGRGDVFVNARWTAGASLRAILPARLEGTLRLTARDGFPVPYFQVADTGDPTAAAKNVLVAPHLDSYRLPAVLLADLRLARAFRVRGGRLTASVDAFNLLNAATTLQLPRDVDLPAFGRPREIVRPRIVRFGLEYALGPGTP